ncbi:MAG: hypothetical protein AAGC95_07220 [Pseudomonadota bacterium]
MKVIMKLFAVAAAALAFASHAHADKLVVNNDEWTWSNTGFNTAGDVATANFAINVGNFLAGANGTIHAYSNNFGFTQNKLSSALTGAGFSYSTGTGFAFTDANLAGIDALFLGGFALNAGEINVLRTYIAGGGGVYIAGGTAAIAGGSAGEAAAWNALLNDYDLAFGSSYNGVSGNIDTSGFGHAVFSAASPLFINNGNSIFNSGTQAQVFGSDNGNQGGALFAVVDTTPTTTVSEPGAIGLMGLMLLALGVAARRRNA